MKKLLILQETLTGGGAEKVLINILNNIDYSKYEVELLLLIKEGVYLDQVNNNVKIRSIFRPIKTNSSYINRFQKRIFYKLLETMPSCFFKIFIREIYDYNIAFLEGLSTKILSMCDLNNSKNIAWIHIDLEKYKKMPQEEENRCYRNMDKIVCVSNEVKSVVDRLYTDVSDKTTVIYNLIDVKDIIKKSEEKVQYIKDIPTIIGVGRLVAQKRFDLLIKAHSELLKNGIDNKLLILGSGELKDELISLALELGVRDTVEIKEFVKNPYPYMKLADVFVMTSDFEGFSLVVAEAIVLGKCIVATECAGPVELLNNGEYGQLVKCQDISALKSAIEKVLLNKDCKINYENMSLIRKDIFDVNSIMKKIYEVLE